MDIRKLKIDGATPRETKSVTAVSVEMVREDGAPFMLAGEPIRFDIRPETGMEWEQEQNAWLAKWGSAAQFVDRPDLDEAQARKLGENRMAAITELRARRIAGWNLREKSEPIEPTMANRVALMDAFPDLAAAVDRAARKVTADLGN